MGNDMEYQHLRYLSMGPKRLVTSWPIYFVNGFRFHTHEHSEGKETKNSGVGVKGGSNGGAESDYYGVLKEVIQLEFFGEPTKMVVLFYCDWFSPETPNGTRVYDQYDIVEVRQRGRYRKYDPFIIAQQAIQVYYTPYPGRRRDKQDWLVVMKTKPRSRVDSTNSLETPYQEDHMSHVQEVDDDNVVINLANNEIEPEEVDEEPILREVEIDGEEEEFDEEDTSEDEEFDDYEEDD
jgi:hypothetical protein